MSDYIALTAAVDGTPSVILAAAEFDRALTINATTDVYVGFDDTNQAHTPKTIDGDAQVGSPTRFVLPAGKDLWAKTDSGEHEISVIASVATVD